MSKRTASDVEEDTVANVADIVFGFITGRDRNNQIGYDAATSSMDFADRSAYISSIARVSTDGSAIAARLRKNTYPIEGYVYNNLKPGHQWFTIFVDRDIHDALTTTQGTWIKDDDPLQKLTRYFPAIVDGELTIVNYEWQFYIRNGRITSASTAGRYSVQ
jgi:hypothetical protein